MLGKILKGITITLVILTLVGSLTFTEEELTPEQEAWLKEAKIGPYQPDTEDWDAVYEAAKEEGTVNIYSLSSRIFDAEETFEERYPGIDVKPYDMVTVDQIDKLTREQAAGIYNADILFLADVTTLTKEVLPKKLIWNYVPSTLLGGQKAEEVIPEDFRKPLLAHSIEAKIVWYNYETWDEVPIDNLWDLTKPKWKGRVQMKDPLISAENMNFLQMCVMHADEMAAAYEEEFGEPIELSPGIENAGYEFILRLLQNDLVLTTSDGDAAEAVGTPGQTKEQNPLAISNASSKLRYNASKGTKLAGAWEVKPVVGVYKRNFLVMANRAPHPNAAKLLIRWMLGDEEGKKGMDPWFVPGGWPSRSDVDTMEMSGLTVDDLTKYTWPFDPDWIWEHGLEVRDFWLGR